MVKKRFLLFAFALILCVSAITPAMAADCTAEAADVIAGIIDMNLDRTGSSSVQEWIDGDLTRGAGATSEWYILALCRRGSYDFSSYKAALMRYLTDNEVRSASTRLKYALILLAVGSEDGYISDTLNDSTGEQGIMSLIYGLHIMNNGYVCEKYSVPDVTAAILSLQHEDGGWSLTGEYGDVDVTAMTVQALAPHCDGNSTVEDAVADALEFLSSRQAEDGGYASFGVSNPESAAQVLVALSSLEIDCTQDERFIKNGNSVIDGITKYRLTDGSFCHTEGGGASDTATVQAMYAMISYIRMKDGKSPLYIFTAPESPDLPAQTGAEETTSAEITSEITTPEGDVPDQNTASAVSYKPWACLVIVLLGGVVCLVLFSLGKRHVKNFIAVAVLVGAAIVIVMVTNFQSAEDYYGGGAVEKDNVIGTVTLTIRCDAVTDKSDAEYIPADGVILEKTEFSLSEGESVYDILIEAARTYDIRVESNGAGNMVYIEGIGYLYEFDFGDLSGWIYRVNGEVRSVGCGEYILRDGDRIEWLYTCDLGQDVK